VTVQNIQQNPQDTSAFYLAHIYQELSTQPNGSQASIPSSLSNPIEPYTPPTSGVWVNGLWFMSLVISLTCALLATLLQQWARRYLRVAYPRYNPHKRARIRAYYKHGVEKLHIPQTIELLPALLHISLFLFFAGLSVFLFGVDRTIFKVVTSWIVLCVILYAWLTFLPIVHKDSPYSAPLSALSFLCFNGIRYVFFKILRTFPDIDPSICTPFCSDDLGADDLGNLSLGLSKTAEEFAIKQNPDIDHRSLLWTFDSLDEDTDLEKFFEGLPRLCDSETGKKLKLQEGFIGPHRNRLSNALIGLMNRTLSSNLVTELVKQRRMIIFTKVVESTSLLGPWWYLCRVLFEDWYRFLGCIEFGLVVQNRKKIADKVAYFHAQCVAALTVSTVRDRDERWFQLASGLLNVSKTRLHKYIAHSDNILLANVIFIIRQTVQSYSGSKEHLRKDILRASSRTLETVCKLDIRGTLPDLQHEFCGLWNQLVYTAQSDQRPHHVLVATMTLKNIHKLYIALHGSSGTPPTPFYTTGDDRDPVLDDSKSYPACTIDGHRPSQIPDLKFDEPTLDSADPPFTPSFMPMPATTFPHLPAQPSTSTTPFHPSSPPVTLPVSSYRDVPSVKPYSHLASPPDVPIVPLPISQVIYPHTPNVPPGGDMQSPQS
jgi:hypothetical protein